MSWQLGSFAAKTWEALGVPRNSPPHIVLGLGPKVSRRDVNKAYRKLSGEWHQDKNDFKEEWQLDVYKLVLEAYNRLTPHPDQKSASATCPRKRSRQEAKPQETGQPKPKATREEAQPQEAEHPRSWASASWASDEMKISVLRALIADQCMLHKLSLVTCPVELGDTILDLVGAARSSQNRGPNARGSWRRILSANWEEVEVALHKFRPKTKHASSERCRD